MGDSLVSHAQTQAERQAMGNLGQTRTVQWLGRGSRQWIDLLPELQYEALFRAYPAMIIIHVGGNSQVGQSILLPWRYKVKRNMRYIFRTYTNTLIIWSDIIPRLAWRGVGADSWPQIEGRRKRLNQFARAEVMRNSRGRI